MGFRDTHGFSIDSSMDLPKMMAQASGRRSLECLRFAAEMGATLLQCRCVVVESLRRKRRGERKAGRTLGNIRLLMDGL